MRSVAIARLLTTYGFSDIVVCDSQGAVHKDRQDLNPIKRSLAESTNPQNITGNMATALSGADIFIGVSAPNIVNADMIKTMADKPIILALANPVPEIMPDVARSAGAFVVATGVDPGSPVLSRGWRDAGSNPACGRILERQ